MKSSRLIIGLLIAAVFSGCYTTPRTAGNYPTNPSYFPQTYQYQINTRGNYLGNMSANQFDPNSVANPFGKGNPFNPNSINNPFGPYGSKFSPKSPFNPFATQSPKLYDSQGRYRGKLSTNRFDPESISNPFGRYGNPFSPDSINNPFGAGNPFLPSSPNNPFGPGLQIYGQ